MSVSDTAQSNISHVVGVRFSSNGKLAYCDGGELGLAYGDWVVVATGAGEVVAKVELLPSLVEVSQLAETLQPVLRLAALADVPSKTRSQSKSSAFFEAEAAKCEKAVCCSDWLARLPSEATTSANLEEECWRSFYRLRYQPTNYQQMKEDWPAVGEIIGRPRVTPAGKAARYLSAKQAENNETKAED